MITEETARRYFGNEDPLGKSLTFNNHLDLEVTGVVQQAPSNATIQYDFLTSFSTLDGWLGEAFVDDWQNSMGETYLLLSETSSPNALTPQLPRFIEKHLGTTHPLKQLHLQPLHRFIQHKKLGFEKDQVVVVPIREESLRQHPEALKSRLRQHPAIEHAATAALLPGGPVGQTRFRAEAMTEEGTLSMLWVDHDFIQTLGMEMVAGRDFSTAFETDAAEAIIVNEEAVRQLGQILGYFAVLAVFIACLGLFGLAALTAQQRTKEIGVRKVLGASVPSVVQLLSGEFVKLVLIANIVAWPIAYVAMSNWLHTFAYRIDLSWGIFLEAGSLAFAIALLTVSYYSIKAALANPVKALRYD